MRRIILIVIAMVLLTCGCSRGDDKTQKAGNKRAVEAVATENRTDKQDVPEENKSGKSEDKEDQNQTKGDPDNSVNNGNELQETDEKEQDTIAGNNEEDVTDQIEEEITASAPMTEVSMAEQGGSDFVSFLFAGDVCLEEDGFVLDHFDEVGGDLAKCVSPYLLQQMADADIFMLNHEYSISSRGSRLDKYYTFRADPSRMDILKQMSVDIVSLANNHVYDYDYDAFCDTLSLLDMAGIRRVGAGMNAAEAETVQYFEVRGVRIGVVSASRAEKYVITPKATESSPGVFWMYDDTRLKEVVAAADSQCDFLIAYLHWGTEDSEYFEQYEHNIAEELAALGVDAIIGGHPHIVQGMEYVGERDIPVLYSLGDFWFNGSDKYSMMVQLDIYKDGSCNAHIIACRQKDYCVSEIKDADELREYFAYMSRLSPNVSFGGYE